MSDFTSEFWNVYIAALTVISILGCGWLLWTQSRAKIKVGSQGDTTGHVWDGDLAEYNNPLPRWWMWLFWITIVFSLGYLALYPGLGRYAGMLGWSQAGQYREEASAVEARVAPLYAKYAAMDIEKVAMDPDARAMGERLFVNNCAQCHGSDAGGAKGFPSLRDGDWLYGGSPERIVESITSGRAGVMPPMGAALGNEGVKEVVAYVRSLSRLTADPLRVQLGKPKFAANCAACHGVDGRGNTAVGAPNLTDSVWLYGATETAITETVTRGRNTNLASGARTMPAFGATLSPERIRVVAAYVWGLSHPQQTASR